MAETGSVDEAAVARWLEPLASDRGDVAEVFVETRRRTAVDWRDGEPGEVRVALESGVSARLRRAGRERLAFVSGSGEAEIREAIRALASSSGKSGVPSRPGPPAPPFEAEPEASVDRWV
ncbi:MAG: DNA gyrase modulator, partial [Acidobacteriota bacterium]